MANRNKHKERETPKNFNSRNTRDWCKGKEGVEHVWDWVPYRPLSHVKPILETAEVRVCKVCGKNTYDRRTKRQHLGAIIRAYRRHKGISEEDLAKTVGIPTSVLWCIETENMAVKPLLAAKFCEALGIRFTYRMGEIPVSVGDEEYDTQIKEGYW